MLKCGKDMKMHLFSLILRMYPEMHSYLQVLSIVYVLPIILKLRFKILKRSYKVYLFRKLVILWSKAHQFLKNIIPN